MAAAAYIGRVGGLAAALGGNLALLPFLGGSEPLLLVLTIGGTTAASAYNLPVPAVASATCIVGTSQLSLTHSGQGISSHIYAQLVDDTTGQVLGNQVTPIEVTLGGQTHSITVPLEQVAQTLQPGQQLTLRLAASAADYETLWAAGTLTVSSIHLTLPIVTDAVAVTTV